MVPILRGGMGEPRRRGGAAVHHAGRWSTADLSGWRVEYRRAQPVVAGEPYAGYCFAASRLIVVAPFAPDCFERSAIFHELGHA